MSLDEEITRADLHDLLHLFSRCSHKARDVNPKVDTIQKKCLNLFSKDYDFSTVSNSNGELCGHYPLKIVILHSKRGSNEEERTNDASQLRELFMKARFARCRSRFVVPVILFEGKNICRSATLSSFAEMYGRSGYDLLFAGGESIPDEELATQNGSESLYSSGEWVLFNRVRGQDIRLLKTLRVKYICDLMVEQKKVKFGMRVTSSEKVDKAKRYSDFCLCSVPFPGCEFFKDFKDNGYSAEGLFFDWKQDYVDAQFNVPESVAYYLGIDWKKYQSWDLVNLTRNYLLLLLRCIKDGDGGVLVHCISGWDRTPLFISLLRLSLWADGQIHTSLGPAEILYLTISYDWFLFGHGLPERLQRGEEVFYFCFNFLKHITSDDFSVNPARRGSVSAGSAVKRSDSVGQFDGTVLLEDRSCRGSDSSLNSCSSVTSEQRMSYFVGQEVTEDMHCSPYSSRTSLTNGYRCPAARSSPHRTSPRSHTHVFESEAHSSLKSTSPLPVPQRSRNSSNASDQKSSCSSICGSWQLISGTGSPKGTTSHLAHSGSSASLSDNAEESSRQQRLDTVRTLFHRVYARSVGYSPPESSAFSHFIDNVTERFRDSWGTAV